MNPSVTLTFLWLGRIHRWDAAWYVAAQFTGAIAGVLAARQILGTRLSASSVQYMVTVPARHGNGITFAGEFLLSGILMASILYSSNHRRLTRYTPTFVAVLRSFFSYSHLRGPVSASIPREPFRRRYFRVLGKASGSISSHLAWECCRLRPCT
jgi:glycerol uptake facilitator-like aquaporin